MATAALGIVHVLYVAHCGPSKAAPTTAGGNTVKLSVGVRFTAATTGLDLVRSAVDHCIAKMNARLECEPQRAELFLLVESPPAQPTAPNPSSSPTHAAAATAGKQPARTMIPLSLMGRLVENPNFVQVVKMEQRYGGRVRVVIQAPHSRDVAALTSRESSSPTSEVHSMGSFSLGRGGRQSRRSGSAEHHHHQPQGGAEDDEAPPIAERGVPRGQRGGALVDLPEEYGRGHSFQRLPSSRGQPEEQEEERRQEAAMLSSSSVPRTTHAPASRAAIDLALASAPAERRPSGAARVLVVFVTPLGDRIDVPIDLLPQETAGSVILRAEAGMREVVEASADPQHAALKSSLAALRMPAVSASAANGYNHNWVLIFRRKDGTQRIFAATDAIPLPSIPPGAPPPLLHLVHAQSLPVLLGSRGGLSAIGLAQPGSPGGGDDDRRPQRHSAPREAAEVGGGGGGGGGESGDRRGDETDPGSAATMFSPMSPSAPVPSMTVDAVVTSPATKTTQAVALLADIESATFDLQRATIDEADARREAEKAAAKVADARRQRSEVQTVHLDWQATVNEVQRLREQVAAFQAEVAAQRERELDLREKIHRLDRNSLL